MAIGAVVVTPETSFFFGIYEKQGAALAKRGTVGPVVADEAGARALQSDIMRENPGRTVLAFRWDPSIMRWRKWL